MTALPPVLPSARDARPRDEPPHAQRERFAAALRALLPDEGRPGDESAVALGAHSPGAAAHLLAAAVQPGAALPTTTLGEFLAAVEPDAAEAAGQPDAAEAAVEPEAADPSAAGPKPAAAPRSDADPDAASVADGVVADADVPADADGVPAGTATADEQGAGRTPGGGVAGGREHDGRPLPGADPGRTGGPGAHGTGARAEVDAPHDRAVRDAPEHRAARGSSSRDGDKASCRVTGDGSMPGRAAAMAREAAGASGTASVADAPATASGRQREVATEAAPGAGRVEDARAEPAASPDPGTGGEDVMPEDLGTGGEEVAAEEAQPPGAARGARDGQVLEGARRALSRPLSTRVAELVERLEQAPPPRRITVELGELRLTVSLRGEVVHVSAQGTTPPDWQRELAAGLAQRGLTLAADAGGDDADGRGRDSRPARREPVPDDPAPRRRPSDGALRL